MWDVQHLKVLSILKCEGAKMVVWPSYNSMKIMVGMMLVVLVGMHQVSKMLQDVGPPKTVDSISHHSNDTVRRLEEQHKDDDNGGEYTHGKTRVVSHGVLIEDMKQRLDVVQVNTLQSKQEMEQMRTRVMELEQDLHMFKHHLSESVEFRPLKSPEFSKHLEQGEERFDGHTHHYFMSEFKGRGMKQGPPEFFCFPSSPSSSSSLEPKPSVECLPGLFRYEAMVVLRPDITEQQRLELTQRYEEVGSLSLIVFILIFGTSLTYQLLYIWIFR